MQKEQIEELVKKYFNHTATAKELDQLSVWYRTMHAEEVEWFAEIQNEEEILKAAMLQYIRKETGIACEEFYVSSPVKTVSHKLWPRIAAAAAILLAAGAGLFFYINSSRHVTLNRHASEGRYQSPGLASQDIKPGSNKAYLTLANGKRVSLTDAANGALAKEAGVEVSKTADGQVVYAVSGTSQQYSNAHNTIETPRGGQYQVILPDGSKVWLNAASKLIYPVSFKGRERREISFYGEAYFEIFKNKLQPFVVKSKNQEVTVLGTHFNINSYYDEPSIKTTLLEGSVQVTPTGQKGKVLKPGEQAMVAPQFLKILQVDVEQVTAWKNGKFLFKEEPIESVMRKLANWYDIEVIYVGKKPTTLFRGVISRKRKLSEVLHLLEIVGSVHFKTEGRRVYVTN